MTINLNQLLGWTIGLIALVVTVYFVTRASNRGWTGQKLAPKTGLA